MSTKRLFFALWPNDRQREVLRNAISPVAKLVEGQAAWMAENAIPKLFINVEPGQIIFERDLAIIRSWPNQSEVTVRGRHHPQEDSPDDIGAALRDWYAALG